MNDESADRAVAEEGLRERKKRETRELTHRVALELVADRGLAGVTVEMIAERAGISPRTFFNHWATKETVLLGVELTSPETLVGTLREAPADEPPLEALRRVLRDWLLRFPADRELRRLRREVLEREPSLHAMSAGRTVDLLTGLTDVLAERFDGPDARERAVLTVQVDFALVRSAFMISLRRETLIVDEFDRAAALLDAGELGGNGEAARA